MHAVRNRLPSRVMPALLINTSTPPYSATVHSKRACTSSSLQTDPEQNRHFPPDCRMALAVASPASAALWRSKMTTRAPAAASLSATHLPIPRAAPVITQTGPVRPKCQFMLWCFLTGPYTRLGVFHTWLQWGCGRRCCSSGHLLYLRVEWRSAWHMQMHTLNTVPSKNRCSYDLAMRPAQHGPSRRR
jgi:hypothetical protein